MKEYIYRGSCENHDYIILGPLLRNIIAFKVVSCKKSRSIRCFCKKLYIMFIFALLITNCKKTKQVDVKQEKIIPVSVIKAEVSKLEITVDIFGRFQPENQIMVYSKIAGKVLRTYVNAGDKIKKGSLLADVVQENPGQEYTPYKVLSPIDGTVLRQNVDIGSSVNQQTILFEVGSLQCLIFKGQVFGSDRNRVKEGQVLKLYDSDKTNILSLVISKISPVVDSITGGLTVEAEICFVDERPVFAGQTINGSIVVDTSEEIVVPRLALVKYNKIGDGVFIAENNKAVFKKIKIIDLTENYAAIKGIESGSNIITEGSGFVSDGSSIIVQ